MAERNDGERIRNDEPVELPAVESPPLSPADASSQASTGAEIDATVEASRESEASANADTSVLPDSEAIVAATAAPRLRMSLPRRYQHRATMAAWVALVAGFGALFGGAVSNSLGIQRNTDAVSLEQRKATQESIDRLARQVSDLKAELAVATASAHSRVVKTAARVDREAASDVTGSIPLARPTPMPIPRPVPGIAAAASQPAIVHTWRIVRARGGLVDVEGRDGIYEVVPGAVLPGLGPVQSIERRNGHWVVVTPKGLIVSARDRF